jgi:two-component system NtrC family response regulator
MASVLIIDDDPLVCRMLCDAFKGLGHLATVSSSLEDGLKRVASEPFDIVFLDVMLPDGNGLEAIERVKGSESSPEVIIITGLGDPDGAELAIRSGAWDYIEKPLTLSIFRLPFMRALQYREAKAEGKRHLPLKLDGIVGRSHKIASCIEKLANAATSEANVLITGETGTGKELFAAAIHSNSDRSAANFVTVDCAALPSNIVESVLFGHEKGAFTGADRRETGLVKQADGGTLFLDEVGELPLPIQGAFLRVIQERTFRPVGSKREEQSNFRLVAATNRNLDTLVQSGGFRKDLLFRLRAVCIELPPLREHPEDIRDLVLHFVAELCERYGIGMKGFTPELIECFLAYDWPGNVRELRHAMESAIASAGNEPILFPQHLPSNIRVYLARRNLVRSREPATHPASLETFRERRLSSLEAIERRYLQDLVSLTGWDIKEACRTSGLSRPRLYGLLRKHGLARENT